MMQHPLRRAGGAADEQTRRSGAGCAAGRAVCAVPADHRVPDCLRPGPLHKLCPLTVRPCGPARAWFEACMWPVLHVVPMQSPVVSCTSQLACLRVPLVVVPLALALSRDLLAPTEHRSAS
jgi:hypothetical protein